ncbi:MAG TPA: membrane protein insertase YidC [Bacteroidales bacterium]|nr:membrane protein insertase YidC [Bacteroidales bacterium]HOR82265.1 membrane protein insertase YidC [Bacteroidales bacterium]HPJ91523.1 membrane protein insertase YidC [Bacteroidales bacterium]
MDKNTVVGLLLILGLLVGYSYWVSPSKEELQERKRIQDSLNLVQSKQAIEKTAVATEEVSTSNTISTTDTITTPISYEKEKSKYAAFVSASQAPENTLPIVVENDIYKLCISKKGGRIESVEFKDIFTYDKKPVVLFDTNSNKNYFGFTFFSNYLELNTNDFYFTPILTDNNHILKVSGEDSLQLIMRLYPNLEENVIDTNSYIEYVYTVKGNDYYTGCKLRFKEMDKYLNQTQTELSLRWITQLQRQEKNYKNEKLATTIYYSDIEDVENLKESDTKSDSIYYPTSLKWISFKQHFFTSTIIATNEFSNATMVADIDASDNEKTNSLKTLKANISFPIQNFTNDEFAFGFYFGPNKYNILKKYNIELEDQIQLGGNWISWINKYAVIPIFNHFEKLNWSYGIIILILTVFLKLLLFPLAYTSYMSTAKMRVVKPEIEEINKRYPDQKDAMKKQQAIMAMYKQLGIRPMAGCLPVLLQLPILFAMFRFFPSAYELRQQAFLWADDLSSYDSILDLPFNIPFYGDHVSLFTLLMTAATLTYTILNNKMMSSAGNAQQMKAMKWMMYLMPIMFLGIFNNYSSGLSYYYFLVNIITFIQMGIFRLAINEEKLRAKVLASKAKPVKKSRWQQKMEDMVKKQQAAQRNLANQRKKR